MSDDPRAPLSPKPEGEPSTPGAENSQPAKPSDPGKSSRKHGEPGEAEETRRRSTGTLIHRFTGSLRRVTGFLGDSGRETGMLRSEPEPAEENEEAPSEAVGPEKGPVAADETAIRPGLLTTGSLELPPDELRGLNALDDNWTDQIRQETVSQLGIDTTPKVLPPTELNQPGQRDAETGTASGEKRREINDADFESLDLPFDRIPHMTGQLSTAFTGYLRGAEEEGEISDEVMTGRLGGIETQPTSSEPEPQQEAPAQPAASMDDLRGDLFAVELEEPAVPAEQPMPSFTAELPDVDLGEDTLPEDRFGMFFEESQETGPLSEIPQDIQGIAAEVWKEAPAPETFKIETGPLVPSEDVWGVETAATVPLSTDAIEEPQELPSMALYDAAGEIEAPAAAPTTPKEEDLSSLRETLATEDAKSKRKSGWLSRITGSLRKITGPISGRGTGELARGTGSLADEKLPGEALDDLSAGALATTSAVETPAQPLDFDTTFAEIYQAPAEEETLAPNELTADEPGAYPELESESTDQSEWLSELRQESSVEEEAPPTTAGLGDVTGPLTEETTRPGGVTGQLRSFITTILRGPETKRGRRSTGQDIPDELVTGRLERSMVTGRLTADKPITKELEGAEESKPEITDLPQGAPRFDADTLETSRLEDTRPRGVTGQLRSFITSILRGPEERGKQTTASLEPDVKLPERVVTGRLGSRVDAAESEDEIPTRRVPSIPGETDSLLRDLPGMEESFATAAPAETSREDNPPEDRFSMFFGDTAVAQTDEEVEADQAPQESIFWDNRAGAAPLNDEVYVISEEDLPAQEQAYAAPTTEDIWGTEEEEPANTGMFGQATDEDLIASYLGGLDLPVAAEEEQEVEQEKEQDLSAYNLRDVALEGYTDTLEAQPTAADAGMEGETEEAGGDLEAELPAVTEKTGIAGWWAARTRSERLLIIEAAVVVMALIIAIPFFVSVIFRGPGTAPVASVQVGPFLVARPLPADVPYPTGITLQGGWYFPLQKSTFIEGQWQPQNAEWLEGTELRRVVAVPWNPQTEAVFMTFKPGDLVDVTLSNQDLVTYEITSIERIPVSNTEIYTARKPSLVVILFKEDAEERWVLTCKR